MIQDWLRGRLAKAFSFHSVIRVPLMLSVLYVLRKVVKIPKAVRAENAPLFRAPNFFNPQPIPPIPRTGPPELCLCSLIVQMGQSSSQQVSNGPNELPEDIGKSHLRLFPPLRKNYHRKIAKQLTF